MTATQLTLADAPVLRASGQPQTATLFYSDKGWMVSVRTATGFRHIKVASAASCRPTDDELLNKGFQCPGT